MNKNLKNARLNMKLTQREVAAKIGITERNYQSDEAGTCQPGVKTSLKIAELLKTPVENLFDAN